MSSWLSEKKGSKDLWVALLAAALAAIWLILSGCSDSGQPKYQPPSYEIRPNVGLLPYFTFDSAAFVNVHMAAVESALPADDRDWDSIQCRAMIDRWMRGRQPQQFWETLTSRVGFSRVLLTWERGGYEDSRYVCASVVIGLDGQYAAAVSGFPSPNSYLDTFSCVSLPADSLAAIIVFLRDSLQIQQIESQFLPDIADGAMSFVTVYLDETPRCVVTNCPPCPDVAPAIRRLDRFLRLLFGEPPPPTIDPSVPS